MSRVCVRVLVRFWVLVRFRVLVRFCVLVHVHACIVVRLVVGVVVGVVVRVIVRVLVHVFVCVHVNLNMALRIFMSDIAIILSIPKRRMRWRGILKGLSHERGWVKSAENLGTSRCKKVPSIDTTFRQAHMAGQSL
jgi:hypothetical protein